MSLSNTRMLLVICSLSFVVNISLPLVKPLTMFLALVAFFSLFFSFFFVLFVHKLFLVFFSLAKFHFVVLFLDRSFFTALRVHRILASVLSTGKKLCSRFPAHIDSSSLLFIFLQSTSLFARKFCFTGFQDLRILVSSCISWIAWIFFWRKSGHKFLIRYAFSNILSHSIYYVKNYTEQSRVARMLLFHCWNAFLVRRMFFTSLYVRSSLLCMLTKFFSSFCTFVDSFMQNPYHRLSRFTEFLYTFLFHCRASSHICGLVCQILWNI